MTLGRSPLPAELEWLKAQGAVRCLRHSEFLPDVPPNAQPTNVNTLPNAWRLSSLDTRATNRAMLALGYVRARDQYTGHTNFDHSTQPLWAQVSKTGPDVLVVFFKKV